MQKLVCMLALTVRLSNTVHLTEPAVFFHEKSAFELTPSDSVGKATSDFGYSISYQRGKNARLLVGAPLYDLTGRVYQCPIKETSRSCETLHIDLDEMHVTYNRSLSEQQHFYFGASIAATERVFLTCAPLRTDFHYALVDRRNSSYFGAYGTCFYYELGSRGFKQYRGFGLETDRQNKNSLRADIYGGLGWNTLVDEEHDRFIIAESFNYGSLVYGSLSNPGNDFKNTFRSHGIHSIKPQAMTLGNYLTDKNKTYYAFSVRDINTKGGIEFFDNKWRKVYSLESGLWSVGSMFGEALCSADVTRDGRADLFVGAPAHFTDALSYDRGALHIYSRIEPPVKKRQMSLKLTILGEKDGARFGTTLSTNDVDGDSYPEIIVAAPYENSGEGALYILCGFELHETMRRWGTKNSQTVTLSSLKRTQRIEKKSLKSFGFSVQPVPDFNENGSDELTVGAPDNSKVTVYKGVRAVTANVTSKFPQIIEKPTSDHQYTFSSCVVVDLPPKPNHITTELTVKNTLRGTGASIMGHGAGATPVSYKINLGSGGVKTKDGNTEYCKNYTMIIPSTGNVISEVMLVDNITTIKDFRNTWVSLSAQSNLKHTVPFQPCKCDGGICSPNLGVEFQWTGGSTTSYAAGSSRTENVSIIVRNTGTKGCNSCVVVRVSGARVDTLLCQDERTGEYECILTSPFQPHVTQTIDVILKMDEITTDDKKVQIDVAVYKTCDRSEDVPLVPFAVVYDFNTDLVLLDGSYTDRTISDTELLVDDEEIITDEQTYIIANNQSVTWKNVWATITAKYKPYILNFTVKHFDDCFEGNVTEKYTANCSLTISPFSTFKLTVAATISKEKIAKYFKDKTITIESEIVLQLLPDKAKNKALRTVITLEKEQTVGQNKPLVIGIAVGVALLVLLIIIIILYKLNFFKRKAKEELQELKQEIRRRSVRHSRPPSSITSRHRGSNAHDSNMDDIVILDEPLDDPIPLPPLDLEEIRAHAAHIDRTRTQS